MEIGVWSPVKNGYTKPKDKEENDWDANEKGAYTTNFKMLNAIICAISPDEFIRISSLQRAKEAWDLLEVTHEGTNTMKQLNL